MKNLIDADKLLDDLYHEDKDAIEGRLGFQYYTGYRAGLQQAMRYVKLAKLDDTVTSQEEP